MGLIFLSAMQSSIWWFPSFHPHLTSSFNLQFSLLPSSLASSSIHPSIIHTCISILLSFIPTPPPLHLSIIQSFCGTACKLRDAEVFLQKAIYSVEELDGVAQFEDISQHIKMATGKQRVCHMRVQCVDVLIGWHHFYVSLGCVSCCVRNSLSLCL